MRQALAGGRGTADDLLEVQYQGPRSALRPVHDRLVALGRGFGPDVSVVVEKTGVSPRRRRQLGVIGAPTGGRIPLGLDLPATPDHPRVISTPRMMCTHRVDLRAGDAVDDAVDDAVAGWLAQAYDNAG